MLRNISKIYQQEKVIRPLNLTISPGKLTVLIGPSGCGKSTLLKLIMGLEQPDTGSIEWDRLMGRVDSVLDLRRKIGYVIQDGGLFPHLTTEDNIKIVAKYLGWTNERTQNRIQRLCDLVQMPKTLLLKYPLQLSGGQRQRTGLMRALMLDPKLLLLDEPLGALDPMVRSDLQKDLKSIFKKLNKTVLMVTHDMGEAAFFADEIVLMRQGNIVQHGRLEDLIHTPKDSFVTRFIRAQRNPLDKYLSDAG